MRTLFSSFVLFVVMTSCKSEPTPETDYTKELINKKWTVLEYKFNGSVYTAKAKGFNYTLEVQSTFSANVVDVFLQNVTTGGTLNLKKVQCKTVAGTLGNKVDLISIVDNEKSGYLKTDGTLTFIYKDNYLIYEYYGIP